MNQHRLTGESALQAYRADLPPGRTDGTPEDNAAVIVATLLRQALISQETATPDSPIVLEALALARESLGEEMLAQGSTYDDHAATSFADVIRLLAQRTDHAGRLRLAEHLLESAAEIETAPIERGRILADRARTSRKLGNLDLAFEQNQELLRVAKRLRSAELRSRAHTDLAAIAEVRGNYVEFRTQLDRAVRTARRAGLTRLGAAAHLGLGKATAIAKNFGEATKHFWLAYQAAGGKGVIGRASLGNLAQTLLISGRPVESRKISAMLLQDAPPIQSALPTLGCYALASARLQDVEAVEWACGQARRLSETRHHAHEVAEALTECGAALEIVGKAAEGAVLKRRAQSIAKNYGFHYLTFDEGLLSTSAIAPPGKGSAVAAHVAAEIFELDVPRIPSRLEGLAV